MVATVEPQQADAQSKTLEQRRIEAREILMKEKKRQLTSPGVFERKLTLITFKFDKLYLRVNLLMKVLAVDHSALCQQWLEVRHSVLLLVFKN